MKATATNLLKFLQGTKQFIIPIYQRTYSWALSDCQQLWNDILRVANDERTPAHFVGSIVYVEKGIYHVSSVTQLLVIDGQQRLTTLTLLLAALGEILEEQGKESNAVITRTKICNYYLFNVVEEGEAHYKLLLTQSDRDTLRYILEGGVEPHLPSMRMKENYLFFKEQLQQSGIDLGIIYRGISKLIMVDISLDQDHDNPQLIFESLNSTGVDLSQADLIRNYVLMGLDTDEQTNLYKNYWYPMEQSFLRVDGIKLFDRFMRDYLTIKQEGVIPNINEVYTGFKAYYRRNATIPMSKIVADIYRYAMYFINMALLHEKDNDIKQVLADINTLKVDVAYPFLMEVYDDYINQRLSKEDFIAILKLVENYVFRRAICGIPTQGLNKVFATLAGEIDKAHYLESVQAAFLQKTLSSRFPPNEEFRAAFMVKDIYHFRNRNYVLSKLENHDRKELVHIEAYTIEHIMPQNEHLSTEWQRELGPDWQEVHARYLHTIGNLTLTGYNSELSDRSFREKRDMEGGFADSPIRLNKSLRHLAHWNKEEIEQRASKLASLAVELWLMPQLSQEQVKKIQKPSQISPLAEVIGPEEHALAGSVPENFKIVQVSEKRFYLFRYIDNEWLQYGNGKNPWFTLSWKKVGEWARWANKKNKQPFGVGGEKVDTLAVATSVESDILTDYTKVEVASGNKSYTLADYPYLQGNLLMVFEHLRKRILNLDASVREEIKKHYIAYKTTTNFVDIEPQKKRLKVTLNMPFPDIDDPHGLCKDITGVGHYGNGDVEISVTSLSQLDDVIDLVSQSFERYREDNDLQGQLF
jgi:uncharacterized protein with ParB-like and HNH nuclease domain/predicted transport protein